MPLPTEAILEKRCHQDVGPTVTCVTHYALRFDTLVPGVFLILTFPISRSYATDPTMLMAVQRSHILGWHNMPYPSVDIRARAVSSWTHIVRGDNRSCPAAEWPELPGLMLNDSP